MFQSLEYPAIPNTLRTGSVSGFASEFEYTFRNNEFIADVSADRVSELSIRANTKFTERATVTLENNQISGKRSLQGYLAGVEGQLRVEPGTPDDPEVTPYPNGKLPFSALFFVGATVVLRDGSWGGVTDGSDPRFTDPKVVLCEE